ncbi:MAG: hypothetical protein ACQEXO_17520, partial [Pseudomonadota bacterium]
HHHVIVLVGHHNGAAEGNLQRAVTFQVKRLRCTSQILVLPPCNVMPEMLEGRVAILAHLFNN